MEDMFNFGYPVLPLNSYPVYPISKDMSQKLVWVTKPKSKRKRIRLKWEKDKRNWQYRYSPTVMVDKLNHRIMMDELSLAKLKERATFKNY